MIVTIDGLSGTGKSTVACLLSERLSFKFLGSGFIYRLYAYKPSLFDSDQDIACKVNFELHDNSVHFFFQGDDLTDVLMSDSIAAKASALAKERAVRERLVAVQKSFKNQVGLVAEGRDMGTVIFADADYKFYLVCSSTIRAKRRVKQLKSIGIHASLSEVESQIVLRDHQDQSREISPAVSAEDAMTIDVSYLSIDEVLTKIHAVIDKGMP